MKKLKSAAVGEKKEHRKNYVTFPDEFEVPKIEVGETFEAVVEFTRKKDGYCVSAVDGIATKDGEEEVAEEEVETIGAGARRAVEGGY